MSKKKKDWKIEKERLGRLELEERRKEYRRSDYVTLDKIHSWRQANNENGDEEGKESRSGEKLSDKVSLYKGDITILELDAIVNAANSSLLGGGGVDGCIHKAAGSCLYDECNTLNGCETGNAKITCGYDLPAKHVIHTVGPVARGHVGSTETRDLTSCYQNSLKLLMEHDLSTVAFPCISTGIYGFPNDPAADIALKTVKAVLEEHPDKITRVIFCVFLETDYKIYKEKISKLFEDNDKEQAEEGWEQEDNTTPSNKPKSKSEGNNEEEGETADEERASQQDPADAEDVAMDSQKPDGDSNPEDADSRDAKKDIAVEKSSPAGMTKPASKDRGEEDEATGRAEEDTAEAKQEQRPSDTENDSSQDVGAQKDTEASQDPMDLGGGSEERESDTSPSEVDMKAQGEDSQGSDLPSTDSTHSKERAEKKE